MVLHSEAGSGVQQATEHLLFFLKGFFSLALQHRQPGAATRLRARRGRSQSQQTRVALERARPRRGTAHGRCLLVLARLGISPANGRPQAGDKRGTGATASRLPRWAGPSLTGAGAARPEVGLLVEAGAPQRGPRPVRRRLLPPVQVAAAGDVGRAGHPVAQLRGAAIGPAAGARLLPAAPAVAQAVKALGTPRVHGGRRAGRAGGTRPRTGRHRRQRSPFPTAPIATSARSERAAPC